MIDETAVNTPAVRLILVSDIRNHRRHKTADEQHR